MKTIATILFSIAILMCVGCAGDCIKMGGTFEGISGELEYCVDKGKSKTEGTPVLTAPSGEKLFSVGETFLDQILSILDTEEPGAKSVNAADASVSAYKKLMMILKK